MDFKKVFEEKYKEQFLNDTIEVLKIASELDETCTSTPFGKKVKESLDLMLEIGKRDGFVTKNVKDYAGHIEYGHGEEILGVLAHLDVVPANAADWESDPYTPTIRDGKLFARGAMDDKGPLVAAYYALRILKDLGFEPSKRIRIIMGCDEETGSRCVKEYFKHEEMPVIGFSPDAEFPLIFGEKGISNFDLTGKHKSELVFFTSGKRYNVIPDMAEAVVKNAGLKEAFAEFLAKNSYKGEAFVVDNELTLRVYGKSGHGSTPHVGLNAAYVLVEFLSQHIQDEFITAMTNYVQWDLTGKKLGIHAEQQDWGTSSSNVGVVHVENGEWKIGVNYRYPLDFAFDMKMEEVREMLRPAGVDLSIQAHSKPHYVPTESDLVKTLMGAYQKYTNDYTNKPFTIGGGTYSKAIPMCVAFGPMMPGKDGLIHQPNEHIDLEDLYNSVLIYTEAIYNLAK